MIKNKVTKEIYVGQSIDIYRRWQQHKETAYKKQSKSYGYPLYRQIRYYGLENFEFTILEECAQYVLDAREEYWINYYDSLDSGYNQIMPKDHPRMRKYHVQRRRNLRNN